MGPRRGQVLARIPNAVWATILVVGIIVFAYITLVGFYQGKFRSYAPVTLISDRSGLVMELGANVKMRGVNVGRVGDITSRDGRAALKLQIDKDQLRYIPANVGAKIDVTTAFGAKFVNLVPPANPSPRRLAAGAVVHSSNVTSEVNTVFDNVVDLLKVIEPAKLNAVVSALAEAFRGKGEVLGRSLLNANKVLIALNARKDTITADLHSVERFGDTYNAAADDFVTILNAAATTSNTIVDRKEALDDLLMSAIGVSTAGSDLLAKSKDNLATAVNKLEPTTDLLLKYEPEYVCLVNGTKLLLDKGVPQVFDADGATLPLDAFFLFGNDQYLYPQNLHRNLAKGGPGGKPGCGSLPDPRKNFPIRQYITNTGWGTGVDWRPNPTLGAPCFINYLPSGRAYPQKPFLRYCLPGPGPGPEREFGGQPYGAPAYGPGGEPLFPGVPPAEPGREPLGTPYLPFPPGGTLGDIRPQDEPGPGILIPPPPAGPGSPTPPEPGPPLAEPGPPAP
jgi:phospholipid/cholesterol/gamma-HCH transport system substrate-binding protein